MSVYENNWIIQADHPKSTESKVKAQFKINDSSVIQKVQPGKWKHRGVSVSLEVNHHFKNGGSFWKMINPY